MAGPKNIATTVVHTGDRLQSDIQARTRENTDAINANPFKGARVISVSVPSTGVYVINHQLGTPAHFFMCAMPYGPGTNAVDMREDFDQTGLDRNNQLRIRTSDGGVFDICVYPVRSTLIPAGKIQAP
jgi:hypothetical protein